MIVVDGLQRLSTFKRFFDNELKLKLKDRPELDGKRFRELAPKLQNRIEDCNLILYIIDSQVPERARLDIFERVNGGVALTRQQMRNCLFMGDATRFLRDEARAELFLDATGRSLDSRTMRDREFVNRFCAFQTIDIKEYKGDMDDFLAMALKGMNNGSVALESLSSQLRTTLGNNLYLFGKHAFRKHKRESGLPVRTERVALGCHVDRIVPLHGAHREVSCGCAEGQSSMRLMDDEDFITAVTYGTQRSQESCVSFFRRADCAERGVRC